MARVVPPALIVGLGLAACLAVIGAALLVSDSREADPQRVDIDLAPPIAPDAPEIQPLEDVVDGQRTQLARGIDEDAYARAWAQRESASRPNQARTTSAWRGGRLDVRVVSAEDGAPVPGADVDLTLSLVEAITVASRTTDDAGAACFEGLPADIWMVRASATGRGEMKAWEAIGPARAALDLEIPLVIRRELAVRLVDDEGRELTPVEFERTLGDRERVIVAGTFSCGPVGSILDHSNRRCGTTSSYSTVRGAGAWRLPLYLTGTTCVVALLGDLVLGSTPLEPGATEVDVRIGADVLRDLLAPLRVFVFGELDGLPVAGALVRFEDVVGVTEARTDASGRARIDARLRVGVPYTVSAEGFATAKGGLVRRLDGQFVVRLAPGRRIEGFLRDENDQPLVRATVVLHEADESGARLARGAPTLLRTGRDGAFAFEGLEARAYAVGGRGD